MSHSVAAAPFIDILTSDKACVYVRYLTSAGVVSLDTENHGDIEAAMDRASARAFLEALRKAVTGPVLARKRPMRRGSATMTEVALIEFLGRPRNAARPRWVASHSLRRYLRCHRAVSQI